MASLSHRDTEVKGYLQNKLFIFSLNEYARGCVLRISDYMGLFGGKEVATEQLSPEFALRGDERRGRKRRKNPAARVESLKLHSGYQLHLGIKQSEYVCRRYLFWIIDIFYNLAFA